MPKIEKSSRVLYELPPKQQQHGGDKHDSVVSAVAVSLSAGTGGRKEKKRLCTNCKNHGLAKIWKKHKRYCMYRDCQCAKCQKTAATRKNCALQTAKRRAKQEDEQREQELQMNPGIFLDERPVPHPIPQPHAPESAASSTFRSIGQLSVSSVAAVSSTKASSSRTSDYDDSSSIDIGGGGGSTGGGGGVGGGRVISHADPISNYVDIDADSRPDMAMSDHIEDIGAVLKELINRTKEFQNLDAFRLFVLQHNTFDVDKATKLIKRAHEDLKYIDSVPEKDDIVMEEQPSPIMRLSRVAPGASVIALHHQTQPPPLSHHRALVGDYREPSTPVVLDTVCGRRTVNGVGDAIAAGVGGPHPQVALWHPRPVYPFPLPLPTTTTIGFWHSSQPPFPTTSATYPPYLDGEWSRHCRLPLVFNPDPQPEPVNLHNNHPRRGEPRSLDMVERPERVHNRPLQPAVQQQDNRESTRHHA